MLSLTSKWNSRFSKTVVADPKEEKGVERLRKVIVSSPPYRLGTVINESSEVAAEARTAEQH